jgi:hypothetical protein
VMEPGRDLGMDTALHVASVIHHDLTVAEASAWQWWLAVSPHDYKDGLIYTDFAADGGSETILPSKTAWILGQYSRFLRPGSYRVAADVTGDTDDLLISAYQTASGSIALVVTNPNSETRDLTISADTTLCPWLVYRTDDHHNIAATGMTLGDRCSIPPRSVVTLIAHCPASSTTNGNGNGILARK